MMDRQSHGKNLSVCRDCYSPLTDYLHSPEIKRASEETRKRGIIIDHLYTNSPFHLPIYYWRYHFVFNGVTGSGKTLLAMELLVEAKDIGITLLSLDVDGE
jgi:hypothetical protein